MESRSGWVKMSPCPQINDCIDTVGKASFVNKFDLLKGYWQVPLTTRSSELCVFVTPDIFLQYTVVPFGLKNSPATFQRLVNTCSCWCTKLYSVSGWSTRNRWILSCIPGMGPGQISKSVLIHLATQSRLACLNTSCPSYITSCRSRRKPRSAPTSQSVRDYRI